MIESLKFRFIILTISVILALIYFAPNFISLDNYPWWPSKNKLVYGLDIQGGLHLVLSADVDEIVQERLRQQGSEIQQKLEKEKIKVASLTASSGKPLSLLFQFNNPSDLEKTRAWIKKSEFSRSFQILPASKNQLKMAYYETRIAELKDQAIKQSIEVIRNRIDEFGCERTSHQRSRGRSDFSSASRYRRLQKSQRIDPKDCQAGAGSGQ